jgi:CHAD domain-containing protein
MEPDYVKLKEIKPALSDYIREAQELLKKDTVPDDKAVHDIRVLMKKSRAVMKLIISQVDEESFEREYGTFREVGRIMRLWRDTSVHRKTLKDLKKEYPKIFTQARENKKLEELLLRSNKAAEPTPEIYDQIATIGELLNKSGYRIRFQSLEKPDPRLLLTELDGSFKQASHSYMKCRNNPKPSNLHEFRKKAKDFLYQLNFFRPLNQSAVKNVEKRIENLTQNLGKYNDLDQLIRSLDYKYKAKSDSQTLDELIIMIRAEQDRYLSRLWPAAYKVFCPGQNIINVLGFKILMI